MSYYKKKLNDYEKAYFEKFFGNNVNRLLAFRKSLSKRIEGPTWDSDYYGEIIVHPGCQTVQKYKIKGGVEHCVNISRKSVDLYLDSIGYYPDGRKKQK